MGDTYAVILIFLCLFVALGAAVYLFWLDYVWYGPWPKLDRKKRAVTLPKAKVKK